MATVFRKKRIYIFEQKHTIYSILYKLCRKNRKTVEKKTKLDICDTVCPRSRDPFIYDVIDNMDPFILLALVNLQVF